jgi:hypothetical protein
MEELISRIGHEVSTPDRHQGFAFQGSGIRAIDVGSDPC